MPLAPIPLETLEKIGVGVERPEGVVVSRDGRVWASDRASACAEILPDGGLRRVGRASGQPNGIAMDRQGRILIANYALGLPAPGPLQRLDPATGEVEVLCSEIDGRALVACNFPLVDRRGNVWCSHSSFDAESAERGVPVPDGFVFRVRPDGRVEKVADGICFANGLAFDAEERSLYVCQSFGLNVLRFALRADGSLGPAEPYGPVLGQRGFPRATPEQRARFGAPDGCGVDQEGNLWVTLVLANRVVAVTPEGRVETIVSDPEGRVMGWPTNVAWGGPDLRDLYIGSLRKDYVLKARSPVPGLPLAHQR